jgi:hypothetical protein
MLALPWAFAVFFGGAWLLEALGYPLSPETPPLIPVLWVTVAMAPSAIWFVVQWLGRVPGLGWMLARPQPLARVDAGGIDLTLPGVGARRFEWERVAGLVPRRRLGETARLIGLDGKTLADIPDGLVTAHRVKGSTRTLAQLIVELRPDRYGLSDADWAGLPDGFALRGTVRDIDPRVAERRRTALLSMTVLILAATTIGAIVVWFLAQGR